MRAPDFASQLNPSQLEAATHEGGPLLVIAGAGSGKTRTLVHRVAWLVSRGARPSSILLLTFTRKAATEMLARCAALVGPSAGNVSGGTFHSLANSILRVEHRAAGYPAGFGIADQGDAEGMIGRIRDAVAGAKSTPGFPKKAKILQVISRAANKEVTVMEAVSKWFSHLSSHAGAITDIASRYAALKRENRVMDFDDLLANLSAAMVADEAVRERIAARYTHVLVDEYQDTNPVQARITWMLSKDHRNVTAVGDDAQSIYGFRGADFRNIMDFPRLFEPARIIKLEDNYRSCENILGVANGILRGAREKYEKSLRAARGAGAPPLMVITSDIRSEARWAGGRIAELVRGGTDPSEIAVLFRAAAHSFELELELTRLGVPFTKYGGRKFLESAHVKDFLAFLRLAHNPADVLSLERLLLMLPGVGRKGAADASAWAAGRRERLLDFEKAPLRGRSREAGRGLAALLAGICDGEDDAPGRRLRKALEYYRPLMPALYPDDFPDRESDLMEILAMADSQETVSGFLADVTLDPPNSTSSIGRPEGPAVDVTLSTVHSAKGLEWGRVFVLSAVEGRIPFAAACHRDEELEEERRLFYVAVTRAKDELYVMCPSEAGSGWEGPLETKPTRFLSQLGEGALDVIKDGRRVPWRKVYPDGGDGDFSDGYSWGSGFSGDGPQEPVLPLMPPPSPSRRPGPAPLRASRRPAAPPRKEAVPVPEPRKGDRVGHGAFGEGVVLSVKDGKALIDFDVCGRKVIVCRHARLYRAGG